MTRVWMSSLGLDGTKYGAHSYRIGGATAMFCRGEDALVIKTLGRWSSDAYLLYVRQSRQRAFKAAQAACSQPVDDMAQEFVQIDDDIFFGDDESQSEDDAL